MGFGVTKHANHRIGPWTVDQELNRLTDGPRSVPLEPRAMNTLLYLLKHRGRTVSRDELLEHVWGKKALTDHAISVVIASLRAALGDDARNPRYLRTIRKKGYCLIDAPVSEPQSRPTALAASGAGHGTVRADRSAWLAGASASMAVLISFLLFWPAPPEEVQDILGIRFVPLTTAEEMPVDKANLAVVNDLMRMELSRYGTVTERAAESDSMPHPHVTVSGHVEGRPEALQIKLTLTSPDRGETVYGESSVPAVTDLAVAVRALVSNALAGHRQLDSTTKQAGTEDIVLDRARYLWGFHRDDRNRLAYRMVKDLIRDNPRHAGAHALLAEMYAALPGQSWGLGGVNTFNLAERHIQRAEELGAPAKYIWRTRARIAHERDQDILTAATLYRKALAEDPDDHWNWRNMAVALAMNRRFDEAIEAHDKAISLALEPTGALSEKMVTLYFAGRFEEAAALQRQLDGLDGRASVRAALIPYMAGEHGAAFDRWQAYFRARDRQDIADAIRMRSDSETPAATYGRILRLIDKDGTGVSPLLAAYLNLAAGYVAKGVALLSGELDDHRASKADPGYDRRRGRRFLMVRIDPFLTRFEQEQLVRDLLGRLHA